MNPTYMRLKNYLSYKNQEIDFNNMKNILLILGANGTGKSAFMSAFPFAFYGRSRGVFDKELNNDDVIFINEAGEKNGKAEVEIHFEHSDALYKVIRTVNRAGKQTLDFYSSANLDNPEWIALTMKAGINKRTGKRENSIVRTQQRIVDVLGCNLELFINSVFFEQSNIDTFARGSMNDKDNIFKSAINIDKWSDYGQTMSEQLKATEKELTKVTALIEECGKLDDIEQRMIEYKTESKRLSEENKKLDKEMSINQKEIEHLISEVAKIKEKQATKHQTLKMVNETIQRIQCIKVKIDDADIKLSTKERLVDDMQMSLKKEQATLERITKDMQDKQSLIKNRSQDEVSRLNDELAIVNKEIGSISFQVQENIKKGKSIPTMKCPLGLDCSQLSPDAKANYRADLLKEYNGLMAKSKDIEDKKKSLLDKVQEIKDDLTLQDRVNTLNNEIKTKTLALENTKSSISINNEIILELKKELPQLKEEMHVKQQEKIKFQTEYDRLQSFSSEREDLRIENLRDKQQKSKKMLEEQSSLINDLDSSVKQMEEQKKNAEKYQKSFLQLQTKRDVQKFAISMVRKDIPHLLIKNMVPELRDYTREFVYRLSSGNMDMDFRLDKQLKTKTEGANITNAFEIWADVAGKSFKYQQCSGGERARLDVAIHLAYIVFKSSRSKSETLWLDEVGSALDAEGVEIFVQLIKELMVQYGFKKIFLVTHNVAMAKLIDNTITMSKDQDGSHIKI